jgi:hypothetical protein
VKSFRIVVLLLMALLIPVRGAVAATMLCAGAGEPPTPVAVEHVHHAMHGDQTAPADHPDHAGPADQVDHAMTAGSDTDHDGSGLHAGACQVCASDCHAVPLAAAAPSLDGPILTASAAFPAFKAPAPAFQSGGQDRPPRTP